MRFLKKLHCGSIILSGISALEVMSWPACSSNIDAKQPLWQNFWELKIFVILPTDSFLHNENIMH